MKKEWLMFLGVVVLLAGCVSPTATSGEAGEEPVTRTPGKTPTEVEMEEQQESGPSEDTPEAQVTQPAETDLDKPTPQAERTRVPAETPSPEGGDPVTQLVQQVKDDLSKRLELDIGAIELVRAEAVTWRDGSLGCPQPGMSYLQVLSPGYRIELRAGGKAYLYHTQGTAYFVLCDNPAPGGELEE